MGAGESRQAHDGRCATVWATCAPPAASRATWLTAGSCCTSAYRACGNYPVTHGLVRSSASTYIHIFASASRNGEHVHTQPLATHTAPHTTPTHHSVCRCCCVVHYTHPSSLPSHPTLPPRVHPRPLETLRGVNIFMSTFVRGARRPPPRHFWAF